MLFHSTCLISRVPEGFLLLLLLYLLLLAYVCLVSSCASFLFYFLTGVESDDLFVRVTWGAGYCCLVPEKISVCFCWALLGTGRPKQRLEVFTGNFKGKLSPHSKVQSFRVLVQRRRWFTSSPPSRGTRLQLLSSLAEKHSFTSRPLFPH